jgi:hypothetical protein
MQYHTSPKIHIKERVSVCIRCLTALRVTNTVELTLFQSSQITHQSFTCKLPSPFEDLAKIIITEQSVMTGRTTKAILILVSPESIINSNNTPHTDIGVSTRGSLKLLVQ